MKKQTIELDHGTLKVQTKAYVFGEWAAHPVPQVLAHRGWRVSHAPTGVGTHNLCDELDRGDAIRIARELSIRVPGMRVAIIKSRIGPPIVKISKDEAHIICATFGEVLGA